MIAFREMVGRFCPSLRVLALVGVTSVLTIVAGSSLKPEGAALAAAPPCDNYSSEITPPENIGVVITTFPNGYTRTGVQYVDFKTYVKNVLPNEWLPNWPQGAYQAGALAVKQFGWYFVNHWRGQTFNGQCFHVEDNDRDQRYIANSQTVPTGYAAEQTWNWLLQSGGKVYATYHQAGYSSDACGQYYGSPRDGVHMSQYGSQACALANTGWPRISVDSNPNTGVGYYFPNSNTPIPAMDLTGDHIYGQWHGALTWGGAPWTPVSVSPSAAGYSTWKFKSTNNCGPPSITPFDYGLASDIKVVGDWDGDGSHTQGVARLGGGTITWYLRNSRTAGAPSYTAFAYGGYGDIPVVGDWDGNGSWTPGVYRNGHWLLSNTNAFNPNPLDVYYGSGGDTPEPGKWKTSGSQPVTIGVIRQAASGNLSWWLRDSNTPGNPTIPVFEYGGNLDRPITGDFIADTTSQFGAGIVRDDVADCTPGTTPNQGWYLRYTPTPGSPNITPFRYELIRP